MIITLSRKDRVLGKPAVLLLWEASLLPWGTFTSSIGHGLSPPSSHQPRGHPAGWDNQVPICSLASTLWWEDTHHSTFWPGKVARANASIQILEKTPLSTQNSLRAKLLFWKHFIYLFLAVLGLHCYARIFSSCGEWGLLFIAIYRLLIAMASLVESTGVVESSWTRDQTHALCFGKQILKHWTTREVPMQVFSNGSWGNEGRDTLMNDLNFQVKTREGLFKTYRRDLGGSKSRIQEL